MSTHKEYALIAILASAAVLGILPVYAVSPGDTTTDLSQIQASTGSQIMPISVSTDKDVYDKQSVVIVTGHVQNAITGQTVTMRVSDPIRTSPRSSSCSAISRRIQSNSPR